MNAYVAISPHLASCHWVLSLSSLDFSVCVRFFVSYCPCACMLYYCDTIIAYCEVSLMRLTANHPPSVLWQCQVEWNGLLVYSYTVSSVSQPTMRSLLLTMIQSVSTGVCMCVCMSVCQCGVNVDLVNADGDSALQCAIRHGCLLTSIMLLSRQHATLYVSSLYSTQVGHSASSSVDVNS